MSRPFILPDDGKRLPMNSKFGPDITARTSVAYGSNILEFAVIQRFLDFRPISRFSGYTACDRRVIALSILSRRSLRHLCRHEAGTVAERGHLRSENNLGGYSHERDNSVLCVNAGILSSWPRCVHLAWPCWCRAGTVRILPAPSPCSWAASGRARGLHLRRRRQCPPRYGNGTNVNEDHGHRWQAR